MTWTSVLLTNKVFIKCSLVCCRQLRRSSFWITIQCASFPWHFFTRQLFLLYRFECSSSKGPIECSHPSICCSIYCMQCSPYLILVLLLLLLLLFAVLSVCGYDKVSIHLFPRLRPCGEEWESRELLPSWFCSISSLRTWMYHTCYSQWRPPCQPLPKMPPISFNVVLLLYRFISPSHSLLKRNWWLYIISCLFLRLTSPRPFLLRCVPIAIASSPKPHELYELLFMVHRLASPSVLSTNDALLLPL